MLCDECNKHPIHNKNLSLDNFLKSQYYYTFSIYDVKGGKYDCELETEYAKYIESEKFYHVYIDLKKATSACRIGSCNGKETLAKIIGGINNLKVPHLDISNMTDIHQLLDKLKLYNLFS
jgi:hypothetical protein